MKSVQRTVLPAVEPGDRSLILWAESPDEARTFLKRVEVSGAPWCVSRVYVAKRSGESRQNTYLNGQYYVTSNDPAVMVFNQTVSAPPRIVDLVKWCTCDVMLSHGESPCVVIEDTTHIVRMNLYQRFPRLARAAMLGIPSAVLQGTRGLDFALRGDCWGLYRYLQAFAAAATLHRDSPSLPLLYAPTIDQVRRAQDLYIPAMDEERVAQDFMINHISALLGGNLQLVAQQRAEIMLRVRRTLDEGIDGSIPPDLPSIDHSGKEVIVHVGAKPDKKSWREKGSGQMDPYIGLILAAKYIYCYDDNGEKIKPLVVDFTYLPPGFWFFSNPETTALYKRLPLEFADDVRYGG